MADEATRSIPVMLLTASAQSDIAGGVEVGADDYVKKPFTAQELQARTTAVRMCVEQATPAGASGRSRTFDSAMR